jgi:hypothetical protein
MKRAHFCTMEAIGIASLGLVAWLILAPATNAQPFPTLKTKVALVQKFQPVFRSYPGISTDLLGIQTGMSVAKAEAVAEKSYAGKFKPAVNSSSDSLTYGPGNFTIQSSPYVSEISFSHQRGPMYDMLDLDFSSPVTGNTLLAMSRQISYNQDSHEQTPPVSTIKALLIKKYGPASYQSETQDGGLKIGWVFGQKKLSVCKTPDCMGAHFIGLPNVFCSGCSAGWSDFLTRCGATASGPNIFRIDAKIDANKSVKTEVSGVTVSIWDAGVCLNDGTEAKKQLTAAAIKHYKATYKPPAGPTL